MLSLNRITLNFFLVVKLNDIYFLNVIIMLLSIHLISKTSHMLSFVVIDSRALQACNPSHT